MEGFMLIKEKKNEDIKNEEKKNEEICPNCGSTLECSDYIYRRTSSFSGFQCSKCGYFEFYDDK